MAEQEAAVVVEQKPVVPVVPAVVPETPETPAPSKVYSQEEVDRITSKVKKNAAYRAKKEAEAYYKGLQQGSQVVAPKPVEEPNAPQHDAEPQREQFPDYEAYLRSVAKWEGRRTLREERAKDRKEQEQRTEKSTKDGLRAEFVKQSEALSAEIEDFQEVMETRVEMPDGMVDALLEADNKARIAYHLAKNPEELKRIAALSSARQAVEIGKLDAKLATEAKTPSTPASADTPAETVPAKPAREPSKAPEPIKPVGGKTATVNEEPDAGTKPAEWFKWRQKQVAARQAAARKE